MMKILHVIPSVAPRYGGASQAVLGMCGALEDEGIDSLIAATDADGPNRLSVELERPISYRGTRVIFFSRQWSEGFKYSHPLARWLQTNIRNFDLVEIHAVFSHSSLASAAACRRAGVPYVVHPIGSLDPWCLKQKYFRKRLLWYMGDRQLMENARAVHYTTAEEKRLAEETLGLNHGYVIPLGVDEEILNAPTEAGIFRRMYPSLGNDPYLIVLCRLHPKKGLELLLQVFLDLVRKEGFQNWHLVIAGDGEETYVTRLKHLVQRKEGNSRVLFTGWLEGIQKRAALQEASLFVLPSYQENFSLSVVEAMACTVPVLVSKNVNLGEEILKAGAGWVVDVDYIALRHTFVEALRDETGRRAKGSAARNLVHSRFRWAFVAQELIRFYRDLLAEACNK